MIYAQVYIHAFKLKSYSLGKFVGNNAMKELQPQETDEKKIVNNSSTLNIINHILGISVAGPHPPSLSVNIGSRSSFFDMHP